jgi:hypothetical protein
MIQSRLERAGDPDATVRKIRHSLDIALSIAGNGLTQELGMKSFHLSWIPLDQSVLEKNWTFERVVRILYQAEQNIFAQL